MKKDEKRFSIKLKMYIFVVITVLAVAFGISAFAFLTSANQINNFYKQVTSDNARNFASLVDGDFLAELRAEAETEEFRQLRDKAEEDDYEQPIEDHLKEKGLWEKYIETRDMIDEYLSNMEEVKYLYIVAHGDRDAEYDMYLVDDSDNPIYETGYYEEREAEFRGIDLTNNPEPTISRGDWGWLCSDFKPVYDSEGNCVCIVGCDVGMDDVMKDRRQLMIYLIIGSLIFTAIVLTGAMLFIKKVVVAPLDAMTNDMKKFKPAVGADYETACVLELDIKSRDEIGEIYHGIRSMQINTIDHINELYALQEDKIKAQEDIKNKEKQIGQLSKESYKDALTGVGNKAAYIKKAEETERRAAEEGLEYAIVMVDMNNLKQINDEYGHKAGDQYITGCCRMVCEAYKHSPVFRIGGDEFVAILMGHDYDERKQITDKLRSDFENSFTDESRDKWQRYSAAIGMAERSAEDMTVDFVFKRADKAMYENKTRFKKKYGTYR